MLAGAAWTNAGRTAPDVLHVRGLVVEDAAGRPRIVLGAPVPDPKEGRRNAPATGMVINDTAGYERFGLGLNAATGSMGMGFDAPPGTGDDRNRERINLYADGRGGATIRMLDRETWVRARLAVDEENHVALEFLKFPTGERVVRRLSVDGDTTVRAPRTP